MTRAYNRGSRLTIWRPRPDATSAIGSLTNALVPNAVQVENLRIQFKITKALGSSPNPAEIVITNLAERTRAELAEKPRKLILEVGYDGNLRHLFGGDIHWSKSERVGPDWETTLQVSDGGRAYREARVGRSWAAGTAALAAITECIGAMGFTTPRNVENNPSLQRQFAAGVAIAGRASDELSRLLAPFGLGWSIQDGSLQVLAADEVQADQALVIDEAAGLIGVPSFSAPTRGSKATLTLRTILYPQARAGGRIELRSQSIRGRFKLTSVSHEGDTYGEAYTDMEAVPA